MSEPRDPQVPPTANGRRLLRELNAKISTMETLLGNLHSSEARNGRDFKSVKVDLRARLTACYLARECLRRGEHQRARTLDNLLARLKLHVEHRRFRKLGVVTRAAIAAVDLDALVRRLTG